MLSMSEEEIVMMYREAKNPQEQIGILADLNACDKGRIKDILAKHDAQPRSAVKTEDTRTKKTNYADIRNLYNRGLTDREIAGKTGCTAYTVGIWRRKFNLPPNGGKEKHPEAATVPKTAKPAKEPKEKPRTAPTGEPPEAAVKKPRIEKPAADTDEMIRRYFADGMTDREIAGKLGLNYNTAKNRRQRLGLSRAPKTARSTRREYAFESAHGKIVLGEEDGNGIIRIEKGGIEVKLKSAELMQMLRFLEE